MSATEPIFHSVSHRNNMNVVRYYLSFCVLLAHFSSLTGNYIPWLQRGTVDVGCFFAISGFLMFPSFQKRPTLRGYLKRRARRILPPYVLIIVLAAVGFVFVSTLPATCYFTDSGFWKYLAANLSFLNFLHPDLPGVFEGEQFATNVVNGALWTMKGEWVCYLSVPVVYWIIRERPRLAGPLLITLAAAWIIVRLAFINLYASTGNELYDIIARQFGTLLVFFYIGAIINRYFPLFQRYKWWILGADALILIFSDHIPLYYLVFQPLVAGSLVLWFSMIGSWGARLSKHDSVSYDIYLFHFPVIQLAVWFGLPAMMSLLGSLAVVVAVTVGLAFASWNLVGKRFKPAR